MPDEVKISSKIELKVESPDLTESADKEPPLANQHIPMALRKITTPARKRKRKKLPLVITCGAILVTGMAAIFMFKGMNTAAPGIVGGTSPGAMPGPVEASSSSYEQGSYYNWSWLDFLVPTTNTRPEVLTQFSKLGEPLGLLMPIALLIGIAFYGQVRANRRKYIKLDNLGLLLTESSKGQAGARFVPWACIDNVKLKTTKSTDNPLIIFEIDDDSEIKIRWLDVVACIEPGTFINALRTYAGDAATACQFPGQVGQVDANTYTQLWFKYYSTASDRKRTTQLVEGDQLHEGRYSIAGQIGGGGQGTAYLAIDRDALTNEPTEVVLKEYILPVHRGEKILQQTVEKLEQEAAILGIINHPGIVKMLDCFVEDHRGYLAMEYVGGRSLKELVQQEGVQPEHIVRDIANQVIDVLSYLHKLTPPVVHRDLTPDNLILQDNGLIKLVDFNVAHQLESAATATVVGKHCYIPPEQFRGKPTAQSDIYAFGGTLQYLLTGEDPEPLSVSRPQEKNDKISDGMNKFVAIATCVDAARRFADVEAMRAELEALSATATTCK